MMRWIICAMLIVLSASGAAFGESTAETIYFLSDDLKSAISYYNKRNSDMGSPGFMFTQGFNKQLIMYARPKTHQWENTLNGEPAEVLRFPFTSNFAYLQRHLETSDFLLTKDNLHFQVWVDGSQCIGDGCLMDENIIVAVLPQKFKVTNYKANVEGDWKITGNTYTFYSKKVKGASVLIDFEDTMPYAYAEVAKALAKFNDINIAYDGENVKVAMPSEGMFASGQITIEKKGKEWLYNLAETLKRIKIKELRVEGHTDNIPIKKSSQKLYPSNWELSAGRAANIVRFLIDAGLDYKKLAAVGYADSRPVVDNDTPANRAKNRRIEFTIVPVDEGPESESNTDQKAEIQ